MATTTMPEVGTISESVVFLSIHFNRFGNTRKVASNRVDVDADKRRIGVTKRLLSSESLQAITRVDYEVLRYMESRCLPFEKGMHALAIALVEEVDAKLKEYRAERNDLIEVFLLEYPSLLDGARRDLRVLFEDRDYATVEEARKEFGMRWNYLSLSTPGQLAQMSEGLYAEERAKIQDKMRESYEEWRSLMRVAMLEVVNRLSESLRPGEDGKTRKLTDSSVNRLQDFLATFPFRNVSNDAELAKMRDQIAGFMEGVTVEQLRESESLKEKIGTKISKAAASLEVMTQGIRKIRADED